MATAAPLPPAGGSTRLAPDQAAAIYQDEIASKYLPKSQRQTAPLAIITGGQPGSGKSQLVDQAVRRIGQMGGGYVLVDADKLRQFHPRFNLLLATVDKTAADLTHADCGAWAARLMRDGAAGRRHLIIDQTSRDPAVLERIAAGLRPLGYRIELHVMATPPLVSEQRIHTRYEDQKAAKGSGRYSNKVNHDAALGGILDTVQAAEERALVDRLCLYDKEAQPIYDKVLDKSVPGTLSSTAQNARSTLEAARAKPLSSPDARALFSECNRLRDMVKARSGTQAEMDAVRDLSSRVAASSRP